MSSYAAIRIETAKLSSIIHNIRNHLKKISQNQSRTDRPNFMIYNNEVREITEDLLKEVQKELKLKFINNMVEHKQKRKLHTGRKHLKKGANSTGEGVLFFSNSIEEKMKNGEITEEDLLKEVLNMKKEFEELLDTEILKNSIVLHMDEKTPHLHFHFKNFNSKGQSVTHMSKIEGKLSLLQDLVGQHFSKWGFKRGVKKEITQSNHTKTSDWKQQQELVDITKEISVLKEEVKQLKELRKKITSDLNLSKEDKKKLYSEITTIQKEKRELTKKYKSINSKYKELLSKKNVIDENIEIINNLEKEVETLKKSDSSKSVNKLVNKFIKKTMTGKEIIEDIPKFKEELEWKISLIQRTDNNKNEIKRLENIIINNNSKIESDDKIIRNLETKNNELQTTVDNQSKQNIQLKNLVDYTMKQNPNLIEDYKEYKRHEKKLEHINDNEIEDLD